MQRPDAVRITHILVYVDERNRVAPATGSSGTLQAAGGGSVQATVTRPLTQGAGGGTTGLRRSASQLVGGLDWFTVIIISYVLWMVVSYALKDRHLRRWLGL